MKNKSCSNSDTQKEGYTLKTGEGRCSVKKGRGKEISGQRFVEFGASGKKRDVEALIILFSCSKKESVYFHTPELLFQLWQSKKAL